MARDILRGNIALSSVAKDLTETVNKDLTAVIANFMTRTNLQKVDWDLFTKVEKDKVTIEHILPQTPTKWYRRNQSRQYTEDVYDDDKMPERKPGEVIYCNVSFSEDGSTYYYQTGLKGFRVWKPLWEDDKK